MARRKGAEENSTAALPPEAPPPGDAAEQTLAQASPPTPPDTSKRPVFMVGPIPTSATESVAAALWANEITVAGVTFTVFNCTVESRYKDGAEWKSGRGFRSSQIPTLIYCLQKCFEHACDYRDPQSVPI